MQNIFSPSPNVYQEAKRLILADALVAFPTETIYGLGANALSDLAVQKIFAAKGRPSDNPLIIHLGTKEQITDYAWIENTVQQRIIDQLMPWPLTLLLPKKPGISRFACGVPLVGIRLPSNHVAQAFLQTVGVPIAAPSANLSGKPSPTTAQMVYDHLGDQVSLIIDGGESEAGIESSVLRVVEEPEGMQIQILRPGFVTKEDLQALFGDEVAVSYTHDHAELSPGMRYKHYSIQGQVQLLFPSETPSISEKKTGFLVTQEYYDEHPDFFLFLKKSSSAFVRIRGSHSNLASCAHQLFDAYHRFDQQGVELLYVEALPEQGIGYAIMNRVKRSAEPH